MSDTNENQQAPSSGLPGMTCSLSSDTPETDAESGFLPFFRTEFTPAALCRKMERERNAALEVLSGIKALISRTDTRGWISHDQRLAVLGNIRAILPENEEVRHGAKDASLD